MPFQQEDYEKHMYIFILLKPLNSDGEMAFTKIPTRRKISPTNSFGIYMLSNSPYNYDWCTRFEISLPVKEVSNLLLC